MCMYACECVYARGWVGVLLYMHVHVYVCTYVHMYTRDFILKYTFLNAAGLSCHCVLPLLRDCGCGRLEGCVVWERAKWRLTGGSPISLMATVWSICIARLPKTP